MAGTDQTKKCSVCRIPLKEHVGPWGPRNCSQRKELDETNINGTKEFHQPSGTSSPLSGRVSLTQPPPTRSVQGVPITTFLAHLSATGPDIRALAESKAHGYVAGSLEDPPVKKGKDIMDGNISTIVDIDDDEVAGNLSIPGVTGPDPPHISDVLATDGSQVPVSGLASSTQSSLVYVPTGFNSGYMQAEETGNGNIMDPSRNDVLWWRSLYYYNVIALPSGGD